MLPAPFCRSTAAIPLGEIRLARISRGCGASGSRSDVGYQIGRQMRIKGIHRCLIGGVSTKADEAVWPHKDGTAIGNARNGRIELRG